MHIPEGMLSLPVTAVAGLVSFTTLAYAVSWVRRHLDERKVVLMAVLGALIFALQMLNFPIQAGTSSSHSSDSFWVAFLNCLRIFSNADI